MYNRLIYIPTITDGEVPVAMLRRRLIEILVRLGSEFTKEDAVQKLKLSPSTVRKYLKLLKDNGLINEINRGRYRITHAGEFYLESILLCSRRVGEDRAYLFTDDSGRPIVLKVDSLEKLYVVIKYGIVPDTVLHNHLVNGYIAKWVRESLGALNLAERIAHIKDVNKLLEIMEEYILVSQNNHRLQS